MKKCRSDRSIGAFLYGVRYDCIFLVVQFRSLSRLPPPCVFSSPAFQRLGSVGHPRLAVAYRLYDCHGGNPMIVRVRSGPDVILKVISSHLIRLSRWLGRSRAKGQIRIDHDAIESTVLSSVKDSRSRYTFFLFFSLSTRAMARTYRFFVLCICFSLIFLFFFFFFFWGGVFYVYMFVNIFATTADLRWLSDP